MTTHVPISPPGKIICVGLNYRDHAAETGQALPEHPLLFAKWPSSVIGPGEPIRLPGQSDQVDFEAELGVVVGERARNVPETRALDVLAGAICVNDVSARDIQMADGQWTRGKSFDTFCPIGPRLVPLDALGDLSDLRIRCWVNGELMQDSTTAQLIFGVSELVAFISRDVTLEPGDVIATGTPSGVGLGRRPPVFLRPGDTVSVQIDGIGELANPVVGPNGSSDSRS